MRVPEWITCPVCGHRGPGDIIREPDPIDIMVRYPEGHEDEGDGDELRMEIHRRAYCTQCGYLMLFLKTPAEEAEEMDEQEDT